MVVQEMGSSPSPGSTRRLGLGCQVWVPSVVVAGDLQQLQASNGSGEWWAVLREPLSAPLGSWTRRADGTKTAASSWSAAPVRSLRGLW